MARVPRENDALPWPGPRLGPIWVEWEIIPAATHIHGGFALFYPIRWIDHLLRARIMKDILGPKKPGRSLHAEISVDGQDWQSVITLAKNTIITLCTTALKCGDRQLRVTSPWREVCRFDDRQVSHREYERRLSGGIRHQRQLTLCPRDNFFLFAETFLGSRVTSWEYKLEIGLSRNTAVHPLPETQELELAVGDYAGAILPLAVPEWKSLTPQPGLVFGGDHIVARYATTGRAFFFPLCFLFWKDKRAAGNPPLAESSANGQALPVTWRQLTVSECLRKVSADEAVGFRFQLEKRQWLLYRSLTPPANRAVLGHNLVSEFLLARFTPKGQVIPLVEVELDEESDSTSGTETGTTTS